MTVNKFQPQLRKFTKECILYNNIQFLLSIIIPHSDRAAVELN